MRFGPIPFDWVQRHTAGAVRQGVSLETLLTSSLIEPRHGDNRDVISPTQRLLLCMNTVLAVEDATHGLARAGVGVTYPAIGLRMALGCTNLEGAIEALGRLYASASTAVHIQLKTQHEAAILSVHMDAEDDRDVAYLEENYLNWMFIHCLHFLGRAPPVSEVTVRDPFHFNLGRPHWGIGAPVSYGDVTSFRFPRGLLGEPTTTRAGANVQWECHQLWLSFVEDGGSRPAAPTYVSGSGFVRFSDMARESGASPRTLRRHLQMVSGRFRDVRQRALVDAASDRLRASDESVETIAAELGYSDGRSFRRFLKNATGFTPQQVRDRRRAETEQDDVRALHLIKILGERMNI